MKVYDNYLLHFFFQSLEEYSVIIGRILQIIKRVALFYKECVNLRRICKQFVQDLSFV